jgi:hypothetical protein
MIEILPQSSETCIGFKISGKLSVDDYDRLLPKLDEGIAAHGKISLLVLMGDFEGWASLDAAKADFKLGTQQYRQVERTAFVGEKKWQEWMVKLMDPFTRRVDERYLDLDRLDEAWQWIEESQ